VNPFAHMLASLRHDRITPLVAHSQLEQPVPYGLTPHAERLTDICNPQQPCGVRWNNDADRGEYKPCTVHKSLRKRCGCQAVPTGRNCWEVVPCDSHDTRLWDYFERQMRV